MLLKIIIVGGILTFLYSKIRKIVVNYISNIGNINRKEIDKNDQLGD